MSEYSYDDSGDNTTIFLLSGLCLYLVPATYFRVAKFITTPEGPARDGSPFYEFTQKKKCKVIESKERKWSIHDVLFGVAWLATIVLLWKASGITATVQEVWNPYEILGLDEGATPKEIKSAYRKLSLVNHPDKNPENETIHELYMEIVKAHQTLTDDAVRENWEKFGHPDGKRSTEYGIALPEFLISDTYKWVVLALYFLGIMVFMPVVVAQWWWNSKRYTRDRILRQTINLYYQFLRPQMTTAQIVDVVTAAVEFQDEVPQRDTDKEQVAALIKLIGETKLEGQANDLMARFSENQVFDAPYCIKARALLTAHMFRITDLPAELHEDQQIILNLVPNLIQGMVNMASLRKWAPMAAQCMKLSALVYQALISDKQPPIFQFPGVETNCFRRLIADEPRVFDTATVLTTDKEVVKKRTEFTDAELEAFYTVVENVPFVHIDAVPVSVGEEKIYEGALCTVKVSLTRGNFFQTKERDENKTTPTELLEAKEKDTNLRRRKGGDSDDSGWDSDDDGVEVGEKKDKIFKDAATGPIVYAPYYPKEVQECWWVFLADNRNQMLTHAVKVDDLVTTKSLDIVIPPFPKAGKYTITLCLFSNSYVGSNKTQEVEITVEPPPAPEEPSSDESEEEDDHNDEAEEESDLESDFEDE